MPYTVGKSRESVVTKGHTCIPARNTGVASGEKYWEKKTARERKKAWPRIIQTGTHIARIVVFL